MDLPTDPHPPYSSYPSPRESIPTSQKEPHINSETSDEALIYEEWEHRADPRISIWLRRSGTISLDHVNVSYGISKDASRPPLRNEPDIFFTCQFQPRIDAKDKNYIHMYCCIVTGLTILHREAGGISCDCNWWRLGSSSHGCLLHPWGLLWIKKWWQTRQLREAIEDHDRLCSCGCFDVAA